MSTTYNQLGGAAALFGKTKRSILALLFCNSSDSYYFRQIIRATALGKGTVQRELAKLTKAGLTTRRKQGNQVYYQANQDASIFPELKAIMIKTAGVADLLKSALSDIADLVNVSFIFGSYAVGGGGVDSDIDLMVIGRVSFKDVVSKLHSIQETLGREINPSVYTPEDFRSKLRAKHHFLGAVLSKPKIFLIGNESDITKLGK